MTQHTHRQTISSQKLDEITKHILSAYDRNLIALPAKLDRSTVYGRDLVNFYREEDQRWAQAYIDSLNLSGTQLCVLDSLARWAFRNTCGNIRSVIGLLGTVIGRYVAANFRDIHVKSTDTSDIVSSFLDESTWTIRRIMRSSALTGSIDAKIPMTEYKEEFDALAALPAADRQWNLKEEREEMRIILNTTNSNSFVSPNGMPRKEYAARRLTQMLKSVAEYKREDGFTRLRSLLNNGSQAAMVIRMLAVNDPEISRLASDVLDHFHSIDRLLNANGTAANTLLARMARDEIVYDEVLAMGRQQHRIIAVEFNSAVILFSHLLKVSGYKFKQSKDFRTAVHNCLRYSGIQENYLNEVTEATVKKHWVDNGMAKVSEC